jgi:hypothetical protein
VELVALTTLFRFRIGWGDQRHRRVCENVMHEVLGLVFDIDSGSM